MAFATPDSRSGVPVTVEQTVRCLTPRLRPGQGAVLGVLRGGLLRHPVLIA